MNERLRKARIRAGFDGSPSAARAHGWNENTYRAHEAGTRNFPYKVAQKYGKAFKVSSEWLLTGEPKESPSSTAIPTQVQFQNTTPSVPLVGRVQAGAWMDTSFAEEFESNTLLPPIPGYENLEQRAVEVVGDSVNERIPDGHFAIYATIDSGIEPLPGDLVVVKAYRNDGSEVETTIKVLKSGPSGPELWPCSTNKKHKGPVKLGKNGDEVRIIGVVLSSMMPPRAKPLKPIKI